LLRLLAAYSDLGVFVTLFKVCLTHFTHPTPIELRPDVPRETGAGSALKCVLTWLRAFAADPKFVTEVLTTQPDIMSVISELYADAFQSNNPKLIRKYISTISEWVRFLEESPNSAQFGPAFLPIFEVSVKVSNHEVFNNNLPLVQAFAIPVLFSLEANPAPFWRAYFEERSQVAQLAIIDFFRHLFVSLLSAESIPDPSTPFPVARFKLRDDELAYLKAAGRDMHRFFNYPIANEFVVRLVKFLGGIFEGSEYSASVTSGILRLFAILLSRQQHKPNISPVLWALSRFCDSHESLVYGANSSQFAILYEIAFDLMQRQLQAARSAGVAFFIHLMYRSHSVSKSLLIPEYFATVELVGPLLQAPPYKVKGLRANLDIIEKFIGHFRIQRFAKAGLETVGRLKGIATIIKAPELAKSFEKIGELYVQKPRERLCCLTSIAGLASGEKQWKTAYEAQIRVAALIKAVLEVKTDFIVDFGALGLAEMDSKIDIGSYAPEILPAVLEAPEFSVVGLKRGLDAAIGFAEKAGMAEITQKLKRVSAQAMGK
jgi:hypothetical protein